MLNNSWPSSLRTNLSTVAKKMQRPVSYLSWARIAACTRQITAIVLIYAMAFTLLPAPAALAKKGEFRSDGAGMNRFAASMAVSSILAPVTDQRNARVLGTTTSRVAKNRPAKSVAESAEPLTVASLTPANLPIPVASALQLGLPSTVHPLLRAVTPMTFHPFLFASVYGPKTYTRESGTPVTINDNFVLPAGAQPANFMCVVNGAPDGSRRVSSAWIKINGEDVLRPRDFNQHVSILSRPVNLSANNAIQVRLMSAPDSFLTVNIGSDCAKPQNERPIANAGQDQSGTIGITVHLNGAASSDPDGDALTFFWSIVSAPANSAATLDAATSATPSFTLDKAGNYTVRLIVSDGQLQSLPDDVLITTTNSAPVARGGMDQTVPLGTIVRLNGSTSSDADGDEISYLWQFLSIPEGSTASLADANSVFPAFTADKRGDYVIQLTVSDGTLTSSDQVIVTTLNSAPVADAGPDQSVIVGRRVDLNGTGSSDVDGDLLTYHFSLLSKPDSSTAQLTDENKVNPSFVPDAVGTYVIQLVVNDGFGDSLPDNVSITSGNTSPLANAGPDQSLMLGSTVTLEGSASSDIDGQELTYSWALISRPNPSNAVLTNSSDAHPTFTIDRPGTYVAQLIVSDGYTTSEPDTVVISTINSVPVADAGVAQNVTAGVRATLDGTHSSDADDDLLTFTWSVLSQANGAQITLLNPTSATPSFVASIEGNYVLQLIVNDGKIDSSPATVMVTATTPNQAPVVNAGPNSTIQIPIQTIALAGTVADDGRPIGGTLIVQWTQVSGPDPATFSSPASAITQAIFPSAGTYTLRLTANDSQLSSSSDVTVVVLPGAINQLPTVSAGADQTVTLPNGVTLNGTATDDGIPVGGALGTTWTKLTGPGTVSFTNASQPITTATFTTPGAYVLLLTANDGQSSSTATVMVRVNADPAQRLFVSAGPNQNIVWPAMNSVALTGSVSPSAGTVLWTQMIGPNSVVFANPVSPSTTATFGGPGTYVLRLTATDSGRSTSADVTVFVGHLTCTRENQGTDFWLTFPGNCANCGFQNPGPMLFISSDKDTTGIVTISGLGFSMPFSVSANQVTTITLPIAADLGASSDLVGQAGIHVNANDPVAVYGLNPLANSQDGYMALPTAALGTDYINLGYKANDMLSQGGGIAKLAGTQFAITATANNTTVTITPSATIGSRHAGIPYTVSLNQGNTYQLKKNESITVFDAEKFPDLTGSIIHSDKPIALFGGHDCTNIPAPFQFCNHLVEQIAPTDTWGTNFVTIPFTARSKGDTLRVLASLDGTHVSINGTQVATIARGKYYEQIISGPGQIAADKPVLVAQYSNSSKFGDAPTGGADPFMVLVPSYDQFGGSVTVSTPTTAFDNYINIVAPSSGKGDLALDGTIIPAASFVDIGNSGFSGAQLAISRGTHRVSGSTPFGSTIYGYAPFDGYGYTGRVCMATAKAGTTVSLTPKSHSSPVVSSSCVTATVLDANSVPMRDIGVDFTTSGVNLFTGSFKTDANGQANFCYVGQSTGSDLIKASIGVTSDTASINWTSFGPNQAPMVTAGPNRSITLPTNALTLNGSVTDDSLPVNAALIVSWTAVSGPGAVVFSHPDQASTAASFSSVGTYLLRLTANDSELSASSLVSVTVNPQNAAPVVNPGSNYTAVQNTNMNVAGTASDDGLPVGSSLSLLWTAVSGPGQVIFETPEQSTTKVTFNEPGSYVIALTASDGLLKSISYANVTVTPQVIAPIVNASPDSLTIALPALATVSGSLSSGTLPVSYEWQFGSGPAPVLFGTPNAVTTQIQFTVAGTYVIYFVATNARGVGNDAVVINVLQPTTPAPTVQFALSDGANITKPTAIIGSITSGTYTLEYRPNPKDDLDSTGWITFSTGSGPKTNGTLGTFDPTMLFNGLYEVRLTCTDTQAQSSTTTVAVEVKGNMKVGVATYAFSDLNVPVPGLPLQIVRTYDNRNTAVGDFGIGWKLGINSATLQKSKSLGDGWFETAEFVGFFPRYCLQPTRAHFASVTLPDGKVYKFEMAPTPLCQTAGPIISPTLKFTQLPTTSDTAGATLVSLGDTELIVNGSIPGPVTLIGFDANTFNSSLYKLTTAEGFSYTIDQKLGVRSVTGPAGDTLTITDEGLVHSSGKSVTYQRDAQGRITKITGPDGNTLQYQYSDSGDLAFFIDAAQQITTYKYNLGTHQLINVITPLNTAPNTYALNNQYGESGRLTVSSNPVGSIIFSHDLANQTETVHDPLSNSTIYRYDDDGNVLSMTDALGNITSYKYDANGNKLSETNALNKTSTYTYDALGNRLSETDPLGNVTNYTYNLSKQVLTVQDALGRTTTNVYDTRGNLTRTTDALGHATTSTYIGSSLLSIEDAQHNTTAFDYGGTAYLTKQTDALGNATKFTYDSNGNKVTQTVTRTVNGTPQSLTTIYVYDAQNRLTKTIAPDGSNTQTTYDVGGRRTSSTDVLSRQTTYEYDTANRLIKTNYPDGTNEQTTYNTAGWVTSRRDRSGHLVSNTYDALGRITRTDTDQGLTTVTVYNAIGRVIQTTDQRNNKTFYTYDDAGRRLTVKNALNQVTSFAYDKNGNQTSVTDANSNVTQYVYDELGRRTSTIYPDLSTDSVNYDELGRNISKADQAGKTTHYGYDKLGRLTSVTDALGQVTSYGYDELGNRVSQTDASLHATTYEYDQLGRRVKRTLPLGQFETYSYNTVGNLLSKTDFNGKTTTYAYDNANRLLSKTADPFFSSGACAGGLCGATQVGFTYNAIGRRLTMVDASGTTTYIYDGSNRLTSRATPQGTLTYGYDAVSNLTSLSSSNANGVAASYSYDALNRMSTVNAFSDSGFFLSTIINYTYDAVGNLANVHYPNNVDHAYTYNSLNRLTNLTVAKTVPATTQATYTYTLGAAGNRVSVTELSGRTVTYGYDDLYRLTSESIAGATSQNGTVSYVYDAVGNRKQLNSTLPAIPAGIMFYDANDRISTDVNDNNGNTVSQGGIGNVYDFENHLIQHGAITIVYDADGNRVSQTAGGVTTKYLVDTNGPTGYAQVLEELVNGTVSRKYTYGLSLISKRETSPSQLSFYSYDGHGSVRQLTNPNGNVTDTYDYDAFGNLISQTGTTTNNYLFAGEQYDPNLGFYYNRARYLDVRSGRFWGMDYIDGDIFVPLSLHKYLYVSDEPVTHVDRAGLEGVAEVSVSISISEQMDAVSSEVAQTIGQRAKKIVLCEAGKFVLDQCIQEGVYLILTEVGGNIIPYIGQTANVVERIATHVREGKIFGRLFSYIEVSGGLEARRIVEQKVINALTGGGLEAGVRSLPDAERIIANLRNEIQLDKFARLCK